MSYLVPPPFVDNDQQFRISMNSTQSIAVAVAALLMVAAAQHAPAQVAGGWSKVSVQDANVMAAARFAVEEESRQEPVVLKKVVRARQQVVAGMNYDVTLLVKRGRKSCKAMAE